MSIAKDKTNPSNESLKQLQAESKIRRTRALHGSRDGSPATSSDSGSERGSKRRKRSYDQPGKVHEDQLTNLHAKVTPRGFVGLVTPDPSPASKNGTSAKNSSQQNSNSTNWTGSDRKRGFISRESTPPPTIAKSKRRKYENEERIQKNSDRNGKDSVRKREESLHTKLTDKLLSFAAQGRKV